MHQNTSFLRKSENFLGRKHNPLPRPLPHWEGTLRTTPLKFPHYN